MGYLQRLLSALMKEWGPVLQQLLLVSCCHPVPPESTHAGAVLCAEVFTMQLQSTVVWDVLCCAAQQELHGTDRPFPLSWPDPASTHGKEVLGPTRPVALILPRYMQRCMVAEKHVYAVC
jgi:hypothetical protein